MHRTHLLLFLLVTQSVAGDGKTITKRQAPQSDFVNRMLQIFNFSADGGPGQMMTGLFTMLLNQTSGIFGPMMGMRGGDGMTFFNQLMQQFMSVFGQVSGLWSNRVSRQMASWRDSLTERELPEYELVQTSVSGLSQVGSRLQRMQKFSSSSPLPASAIVKEIQETRRLMNLVWQCLDGVPRPQLTLNVTMMGNELYERTEQQMILQMQEELIQLWRLVSEHIAADVNHSKSTPVCKRVVKCMMQMIPTDRREGMAPSSSTQTIEFEETAN